MKKDQATWNNYLAITWDKYLPPIRPYREECEVFIYYIKQFILEHKEKPKILILGSTPELRDVAYAFDIIPTVIDFSKDNYEGMGLLCKNEIADRFFESNWLQIDSLLKCEKFDFIFSEAAFNVLDKNQAKQLYKICRQLLAENGKIIAKQWIRFSNKTPDLKQLLKSFRQSNSILGLYSYACIPLMLLFYDYDSECIRLRDFEKKMHMLFQQKTITNVEWETVNIHNYQQVDLELYIPLLSDFLFDMNECFDLCNLCTVNIGYSQYHPIFVFTRR